MRPAHYTEKEKRRRTLAALSQYKTIVILHHSPGPKRDKALRSINRKIERAEATLEKGQPMNAQLKTADAAGRSAIRIKGTAVADLATELLGFVEWAEEHRRQAKAAGERPAIDAHRVARARAALKRAGR